MYILHHPSTLSIALFVETFSNIFLMTAYPIFLCLSISREFLADLLDNGYLIVRGVKWRFLPLDWKSVCIMFFLAWGDPQGVENQNQLRANLHTLGKLKYSPLKSDSDSVFRSRVREYNIAEECYRGWAKIKQAKFKKPPFRHIIIFFSLASSVFVKKISGDKGSSIFLFFEGRGYEGSWGGGHLNCSSSMM